MLLLLVWMCNVVRTGARVRNSSLWAGQTDGWTLQRLSKPFVTVMLLKVGIFLEPDHQRNTVYLGRHELSVKLIHK